MINRGDAIADSGGNRGLLALGIFWIHDLGRTRDRVNTGQYFFFDLSSPCPEVTSDPLPSLH